MLYAMLRACFVVMVTRDNSNFFYSFQKWGENSVSIWDTMFMYCENASNIPSTFTNFYNTLSWEELRSMVRLLKKYVILLLLFVSNFCTSVLFLCIVMLISCVPWQLANNKNIDDREYKENFNLFLWCLYIFCLRSVEKHIHVIETFF